MFNIDMRNPILSLITVATLVIFFTISCGKQSNMASNDDGRDLFGNNFDPSAGANQPSWSDMLGGFNNSGGTGLNPNPIAHDPISVGSDPVTGGLTDADMSAMQNLFGEMTGLGQLGWEDGDIFDPALIEQYFGMQQDTCQNPGGSSMDKMMLLGPAMESCMGKIGKYTPVPGQPLVGIWNNDNKCQKNLKFEISDNTQTGRSPNVRYSVSGEVTGYMLAQASGTGKVNPSSIVSSGIRGASDKSTSASDKAKWNGTLKDSPTAGKGTLTHPTIGATKYGTCSTQVSLKTSKNPIPYNYKKAMVKLGQCYRTALMLMSPIFDRMFCNMDPALAQMLQMKMLGIE